MPLVELMILRTRNNIKWSHKQKIMACMSSYCNKVEQSFIAYNHRTEALCYVNNAQQMTLHLQVNAQLIQPYLGIQQES